MNQFTKNVIQNCRCLKILFDKPLPYSNTDIAREFLIDTIPNDLYVYMRFQPYSDVMPKEGDLSLEQIKGLADFHRVPVDFLIDDKVTTILNRLIDIKKELRDYRSTISSLYFTTKGTFNPSVVKMFDDEYNLLKEVIDNETNNG